MDVKKAIKKVIALGAGATMVGATIMGAMAADLSNYPSMFVKDGKLDAVIVVGDNAAAQDVIGSVDIATSLQYSLKTTKKVAVSGSSASTVVEGDTFLISDSGDDFNLYEEMGDEVKAAADSSDIKALASGEISNEKGDFDYDQYIDLAKDAELRFVEDSEQSEDPALYLKFPDDSLVYTYKMTFPTAVKSDIDSSMDLDDLDNKKLVMLGKEYTFIDTDNATGTLELMGGAVTDTISEGETKTYTLNGKEYEVENIIVTDSGSPLYTQLKINGEVTEKMAETETYKLADDVEIGVKTILNNEAGDVTGDLVEFYLGAQKVVFEDADWTSVGGMTVSVGSDTIDNVEGQIVGTFSSGDASISKIELNWTADDDYYVAENGKLSDRLPDDEKEKLFLENIDYQFAGVDYGEVEEVEIKSSGNSKYKLKVPTKTGGTISEAMFYLNTSNIIQTGKEKGKDLHILEGTADVLENMYFVADMNKYSHLLEVSNIDATNTKVKFKNIGSGDTFEVTAANAAPKEFYLDGNKYQFTPTYVTDSIALTDITDDANGIARLWTANEHRLTLYGNSTLAQLGLADNTSRLEIAEAPDLTRDDAVTTAGTLKFDFALSSGKIEAQTPTYSNADDTDWSGAKSYDSKDNYIEYMTEFGTLIKQDTDNQDSLEVMLPSKEAVAKVYLSSGVTTVSESESAEEGMIDTVELTRIQVGAAQLASAVRGQEKAQNLILVGGPCINEAAGVITGWPFVNGQPQYGADKCGMGLEAGEAKIKLYENDGNVAMLVAGFGAEDTKRASKVIANYDSHADSLSGMEVDVSGNSMNDITVSKVEAAAPAEPEA